ncbi:MAG: hydroxyacid dehydrogenase [Opitutaceae bacterium]|nr:hydroxyacid dehydrogenase [Opitutaceae bacterium]MBP9914175.1 hydroxyacid dehydrogenase [Opitutaceae bacterium]
MPRISSILAVYSPFEQQHFLNNGVLEEMRALTDEFRLIDPTHLTPESFARELTTANPEVLLTCWQSQPLPAELPPRLRYMCYMTGSVRRLVTREQIERGFLVTNWGGAISRTVAECALFHVLACLRQATHWTLTLQRDGGWRDGWEQTGSLFGRRVGLHGFGSVAREFVKLIQPFGCALSVFAPDFDDAMAAQYHATRAKSLDVIFSDHDVIVEFAPLNPATTGCVTERHLRLIRPGGVFVNTARAAIVDEAALLRVASEGKIFVGLDVFVEEPLPPDSGFRALRNVSLTPHIAGPTLDRYPDAGAFALRNLRAYAAGQPLEAVVTPVVYDQST